MDLPTAFLGGVVWLLPQIVHVSHAVVGETRDPDPMACLSILLTRHTIHRHPTLSLLSGADPSKGRQRLCCYPNNV